MATSSFPTQRVGAATLSAPSVVLRLAALVLAVNVARYAVGMFVEGPLVRPIFEAMAAAPDTFRTRFETFHWTTSFLYNGVVWGVAVVGFHWAWPSLRGSWLRRAAVWFGLSWLGFAALSGVYMNHYLHDPAFYLWNVADALFAFAVVGVTTVLLYPRLLGRGAASNVEAARDMGGVG